MVTVIAASPSAIPHAPKSYSSPVIRGGAPKGAEGESHKRDLESSRSDIFDTSFAAFPLRPCGPTPPCERGRRRGQRKGDHFAGMAKVLCCRCRVTLSCRGGGHWPGFIALARSVSRSPMFL